MHGVDPGDFVSGFFTAGHVGFTGTSHQDLTRRQVEGLIGYLKSASRQGSRLQVHHGDCIRADAEFHEIALKLGAFIHIHPPANPSLRAFCLGHASYPELPYLVRNRVIVLSTDVLLAAPKGRREELRSGTWATVRYAKKIGRPVVIFYP